MDKNMDDRLENKGWSRRTFLAAIAAALGAAGFGAAFYAFMEALGFSRDILMTG